MEIFWVFVIGISVAIYLLYIQIQEMNSKIDLLLRSNANVLNDQVTNEMIDLVNKGKRAQALVLLRKKTGLSLKYCESILGNHPSIDAE